VKRGELYRVHKLNSRDPKRHRVFVVVSREQLIGSKFPTVICAQVYTKCSDLDTQVVVGIDEGLKHESCIFCDELISLSKSLLTDYVGQLSAKN
jgi:mRNA interferase MazF